MAIIETPWFPCTTNPVHKGWYKLRYSHERMLGYIPNEGGNTLQTAPVVKRYWNGRSWCWQSAYGGKLVWASIDRENSEWCGIMEVPGPRY